jgi:geranylgeranyl diphosphate synthase, type II
MLAHKSVGSCLKYLVKKQTQDPAEFDLSEVIQVFDDLIDSFLRSRGFPENLSEAIRYATLGGGKRLRPALAWASSLACNGSGVDSKQAGVGIELIHAFSLVHDDLPAMDDDDMRRGRPTLHIHTSESMAILAGDAMLSLAYEAVLEHPDTDISRKLCNELSQGTRSMIIGQVFDTLGGFDEDISNEEKLRLIHQNKTGALLRASCRMGAICAGASSDQLELITRYAESVGLQFQIIDDLLDIEGSADEVGKALGKDLAAGKLTYPGIFGAERSRKIVEELAFESSSVLDDLHRCGSGSTSALRTLGDVLTKRTK